MKRSNSGAHTGAINGDPDYQRILEITGSVREAIQRDVDTDPRFREILRQEAMDLIRDGDVETGRSILETYFGEAEAPAPTVTVASA